MILMPNSKRITPGSDAGKEKILASSAAIDTAREALSDLTHLENVGAHAGVIVEGERVLTHAFECLLAGYRGWFWTVTLSRAPRSRKITVGEMALRPGADALLAPDWIPWADRLQPEDVGPTDRLPYRADDPRLEEGYEATGSDADALAIFELGLGRPRVLSAQGRAQAFQRWYSGDAGPHSPATRAARARCSTCGFLMVMGGSARQLFGVCANEWSPYDGHVVSLDHGCGAHSETDIAHRTKMWEPSEPVLNEADLEVLHSSADSGDDVHVDVISREGEAA